MVPKNEYRRKAKVCSQLAKAADNPGVKARYVIVAHEWIELAEGKKPSVGRARRRSRSRAG
jgi:hypothetical protein